MSQLQQAIASGQVLAAQIEAHRAAGELPIVMFEPRLCPANNVICSQGCAQNGACTSNVDAAMTEVFGEIDRGYSPAELPQSLRERCDAEFGDWVNVPVADLRAALDDAERYHAEALAEWAQPLPPTHNKDVILSALRAYQCTEHVDEDGDGSRLVDILTSGSNISAGISEVEALADFLDGALFDAENIAQPVPPATAWRERAIFLIHYDDQDQRPEIWTGEAAGRARFKAVGQSWNAHLFVKVASNSRDDMHANDNAPMLNAALAQPVQPAGKIEPDWKTMYLQATAQTARAEDRADEAEAKLAHPVPPAEAEAEIMAAVDKYAPEYHGKREWRHAAIQGERANLVLTVRNALAQPADEREAKEAAQRTAMAARFAGRNNPATPDFDLPAPNDDIQQPAAESDAGDELTIAYMAGYQRGKDSAQPVQPAAENKSSAPVEFWRLLAEYVEALDEERRDAIEHRFDELFALANHAIDKALEILNEHAPHTSGKLSVRVAQLCLVSPRDAQPVQPATPDLQKAAQAVLDRWNSPKWEWGKQGPTADLMYDLRSAIEADHNNQHTGAKA